MTPLACPLVGMELELTRTTLVSGGHLRSPLVGNGTFGTIATCGDGSNPFPNKLGKDNYLSDLGVHTCAHG